MQKARRRNGRPFALYSWPGCRTFIPQHQGRQGKHDPLWSYELRIGSGLRGFVVPNASSLPKSEHSTRFLACQSVPVGRGVPGAPDRDRASNVDWRLVRRYGERVLTDGYTACPNLVLQHYAALGISEAELVFVLQLWTYWWDTSLPHPSLSTIAHRMGKSVRQLQTYVERLRVRGLLVVECRYDNKGRQLSNSYDLTPLLRALEARCVGTSEPQRTAAAGEVQPERMAAAPKTKTERKLPVAVARGTDAQAIRVVDVHAGPALTQANGVRWASSSAMKCTSPKENTNLNQTHFDSIPPTPGTEKEPPRSKNVGSNSAVHDVQVPEVLRRSIADVSVAMGDEAPSSSLTRAWQMLRQSGTPSESFVEHVTAAKAQTLGKLRCIRRQAGSGRPNAMPYFFAVLERSLVPQSPPHQTSRPPQTRIPRRSSIAAPTIPPETHPIWAAVLNDLQGILPSETFRERLLPTRVRSCTDEVLEIETASQFAAQWLDRMLSGTVESVLRAAGHERRRLVFLYDGWAGPVAM
ncbi:MAG: helix-turn-helix protein [Chloroflexi bacterium]|nr:helix-turn-helix protein [Chloroflexota bacterium]